MYIEISHKKILVLTFFYCRLQVCVRVHVTEMSCELYLPSCYKDISVNFSDSHCCWMSLIYIFFISFTDRLWLTNPSFSAEISQIPLPGEKKEQTILSETSTAKRRTELPEHHKERKASGHKKLKSYHKQSRWMTDNNYVVFRCQDETYRNPSKFQLKVNFITTRETSYGVFLINVKGLKYK